MTFERPLFLLLLVGGLLLWWLRVRRVRRAVVVASVTPFRGAPPNPLPPTPRRHADPLLVLAIVGATALALAAAGPRVGASGSDRVLVIRGRFEALDAALAQPSRDAQPRAIATGRDSANALVAAWLRDAAPEAVVEDVFLDVPDAEFGRAALSALRARGFGTAIVVADRSVAGPFVVAMPQSAALPDLGISAVVYDGTLLGDDSAADGARILVTVQSSFNVAVPITLRCDGQQSNAVVPAGGQIEVSVELPLASLVAGASLALEPGGSLPVGDTVRAARRGGVRSVAIDDASGASVDHREILSVLRAAGIRDVPIAADPSVVIRLGGDPAWRAPSDKAGVVVFAPEASPAKGGDGSIRAVPSPGGALLHGRDVTGHGLSAAMDVPLPGPGTTLFAATRLLGGTPWMSDNAGVLVAASPGRVALALDPSSPRTGGRNGAAVGDFTGDPAFAALTLAALDYVAGGSARIDAEGLRPARGGWLDGATADALTADAVRAAVVRDAPARSEASSSGSPGALSVEGLLMLLGAACLVACAAIPLLRARRPPPAESGRLSSKGPLPRG